MKKTGVTLLAFLAFSYATATAEKIAFPDEDAPLFSITIPDSWTPEYDDEGTLEAEDADGHSYLAVWEEDTETELSSVGEDIDELLAEYATDVKVTGEPEPITLAGMPGLVFAGTAKDKEDASGIGFEVVVLVVKGKGAAIIYYDYSADAPESVSKNLVKILESLKPAE